MHFFIEEAPPFFSISHLSVNFNLDFCRLESQISNGSVLKYNNNIPYLFITFPIKNKNKNKIHYCFLFNALCFIVQFMWLPNFIFYPLYFFLIKYYLSLHKFLLLFLLGCFLVCNPETVPNILHNKLRWLCESLIWSSK